MKRYTHFLSLLAVSTLIAGCNEKISPELQAGNSSTTVSTNTTTPDSYYFKVTNSSPTVLNYVLHRTGEGNKATDCKIESLTSALSNELYIGEATDPHDDKFFDISCFFEAEELSLFFNGLNFKVEASKNTCEYIAYSPFSFFDAIPGSSTSNYAVIECDDPTLALTFAGYSAKVPATATHSGGTKVQCGYTVDKGLDAGSRAEFQSKDSESELCSFDYASNGGGNGQNCDTGVLTLDVTTITTVDDGTGPVTVAKTTTKKYSCGGKVASCIGGPIKQVSGLSSATRGSELVNSVKDTDFSKEYSLPGLVSKRAANYDIVNFRRGLASKELNYKDYDTANESEWGDTNLYKSFDPAIMEKYAANKYPDGISEIITTTGAGNMLTTQAQLNNTNTATPYAADPYLATYSGYRTNPFYTFYCLDRAYDIKARIRMVVRDWDRVFPADTTQLEVISDVWDTLPPAGGRRQDLPKDEEEVGADPGLYNLYNDKWDWDDLVAMTRSDTSATSIDDQMLAGTFVLSPTPTATYTDGWWNPDNFPSQGPLQ
jgi:hypothetical protein